jgi:hypothetical protein
MVGNYPLMNESTSSQRGNYSSIILCPFSEGEVCILPCERFESCFPNLEKKLTEEKTGLERREEN